MTSSFYKEMQIGDPDILSNLRAENKLLRRKTLTGVLDEIKSLVSAFDKNCAIQTVAVVETKNKDNQNLDSDDDQDPLDLDENEGLILVSDAITTVYGSGENLMKSLVLCLSDPVEKCRELAYESLALLVENCGKKMITKMLPVLIPTLVERLGQPELIESSEEVRFVATVFINKLIKKCGKELIPFVDDLLLILLTTLGDPYHEVRIGSCEGTSLLAKTIPEVFHYGSELLVKPLCQSVTHQQSRVRKAVVDCIGVVLQLGSHKVAENYVPHLVQRLFDPNSNVRKAVVHVVGHWTMDFCDRYSHFHRFIPIILTGISDEAPDVAQLADELWRKVGNKYLEENIQDHKDFVDFPTEHPEHYPENVHRPNLGCRVLTHTEVCKLIPGVTHDIMDWQDSNRQKSAQLLYQLILNCEDKMTMHVEPLFQCMFRACLDSDPTVITNVLESAKLLGYFVSVSTCWPLLAETLHCNCSEGVLAVTCSYLKGTFPPSLVPYIKDIFQLITSPEVSYTVKERKLTWILGLCETLLALVPHEVAQQCPEMCFKVLLVIASMSVNIETITKAQSAMDILRQFCEVDSVDALFGIYCEPILMEIRDADVEWTMSTPERLIFTTILSQAGSGIEKNLDLVLEILMTYLTPKRDPEVRLGLFTELAGILRFYSELEMSSHQLGQIESFVKTIIEDILNKSLVWRAGKSSSALRVAALNCLLTILLGKLLAREVVASLAPEIVSGCLGLLDDQQQLNRLFSIKCLGQLSTCCEKMLEVDMVNKIYPELLKRMDDEHNNVRVAASEALSALYSNLPLDYTMDHFQLHLEHAVGALIVHLDDREVEIQNSVFETLLIMGLISSESVISKCEEFKTKHRTPDNCERLIKKLTPYP